MKRPMIRFAAGPLVLAVLGALLLSGCSRLDALVRADEIERQARIDRLRFFESARDAYLLIGNEFYKLARIAEGAGDAKKVKEYGAQASLYAVIYNDMKERAAELRAYLEEQERKAGKYRPQDLEMVEPTRQGAGASPSRLEMVEPAK